MCVASLLFLFIIVRFFLAMQSSHIIVFASAVGVCALDTLVVLHFGLKPEITLLYDKVFSYHRRRHCLLARVVTQAVHGRFPTPASHGHRLTVFATPISFRLVSFVAVAVVATWRLTVWSACCCCYYCAAVAAIFLL